MNPSSTKEPRFVCDDNLGKLARYLRAGGYDVVFDKNITDNEIITTALDENRIILTRDHKLVERALVRNYLLIEDSHWPAQLKQVIHEYSLVFIINQMFTRCLEDNMPIVEIEKSRVKGLVYPYIFKTQDKFRQCPECQRIYWSGTHISAMIDRLKKNGIEIIGEKHT